MYALITFVINLISITVLSFFTNQSKFLETSWRSSGLSLVEIVYIVLTHKDLVLQNKLLVVYSAYSAWRSFISTLRGGYLDQPPFSPEFPWRPRVVAEGRAERAFLLPGWPGGACAAAPWRCPCRGLKGGQHQVCAAAVVCQWSNRGSQKAAVLSGLSARFQDCGRMGWQTCIISGNWMASETFIASCCRTSTLLDLSTGMEAKVVCTNVYKMIN